MSTIHVEDQVSLSVDTGAAGSMGVSSSSSRASIATAQTVGETFSASSSTPNSEIEPRDADGDSPRPASSGTDMTDKPPGDGGEGLRLLLVEYGLDESWEVFVNQLLKDIIESQSSFQVSVDRNEVSLIFSRRRICFETRAIICYLHDRERFCPGGIRLTDADRPVRRRIRFIVVV